MKIKIISVLIAASAPLGHFEPLQAREQGACLKLTGVDLVVRNSAKYVIFGERHGTVETPELFSRLVCHLSSEGPVLVGLEVDAREQVALNRYIESAGGEADRTALLSGPHWRNQDGRASKAMFDLIERLRQLRRGESRLAVVAFMLPAPDPASRERHMAEAMIRAVEMGPSRVRFVALIGRVHAETEQIGPYLPMASYLPPNDRLTLNYVPVKGEACGDPACATPVPPSFSLLSQAPTEFRWPRYDLYYKVGRPFTRSPQARSR